MLSSTYGLYNSIDAGSVVELAPEDAWALLSDHGDEWIVADVRSEQDYKMAHLPGATSVCYASLVVALDAMRPALERIRASQRGVLLYANTGGSEGQSTSRALMAMSCLVEVGGVPLARLARLEGGFDAWRRADLPLSGAGAPDDRPPLAALAVGTTRRKGAIVRETPDLDSKVLRVLAGGVDVAVVELRCHHDGATDRARLLLGGWVSRKSLRGLDGDADGLRRRPPEDRA